MQFDYKSALKRGFRQIPSGELKFLPGAQLNDKLYKVSYKGSRNGAPVMITFYEAAGSQSLADKEFYEQAIIARTVGSHPNIVSLLGFSLPNQFRSGHALVQQYGLYGTAREFFQAPTRFNMKPSGPNYHRVVNIARGVARAMLFLENPGHLDQIELPIDVTLKSTTVTIDEAMNAMLIDFGETDRMRLRVANFARARGQEFGHLSPEIILGRIKKYNIKEINAARVWSFGILVLSICTGEYRDPLGRLKSSDIIKLYREGRKLPIPAECPETMRQIIQSSLNYDHRNRIGFKELVQKLDRYYQNLRGVGLTSLASESSVLHGLTTLPKARSINRPITQTTPRLLPGQSVQVIDSPISAGSDHYGIIDRYGNLSMVGNNDEYQLGNGTTILSTVPSPLSFPSKVVSISCGEETTGAVTADGKVYLWGRIEGQILDLPGGQTKMSSNRKPIRRPQLINRLKDRFAVKIALSSTSNYNYGIIFRDGTAYVKMVVRDGEDLPLVAAVIKVSSGIVDIVLDFWAVYILTKDGKIYTSGEPYLPTNSKYLTTDQKSSIHIGIDNIGTNTALNPVLIPFDKMAHQIAAGKKGLSVLTTDGELFIMNSYGNDGPNTVYMLDAMNTMSSPSWEEDEKIPDLQTALRESKPQKISIPGKIVSISSRFGKVAAVTKDGRLYMWGSSLADGSVLNMTNIKFRKRRARRKHVSIKKPIQVDIGGKVKYLSVGENFSIAVTEDRVVNYWGFDDLKQPAVIKNRWYKNCTNSESYVTLEEWEQQTDYIQIYSRNQITGELSGKPVCYKRASMVRAMETQVFADWVPYPGRTLNEIGRGGGPGKKRFYKTILYYIDYSSYLLLKDPTIREYVRELKYRGQRIGNLDGSFGIGQNHGQSPGFDIYLLKPKTP